jgi:hypothetical protein
MFSLGKPILTTDCTNGLVEGFDRAAQSSSGTKERIGDAAYTIQICVIGEICGLFPDGCEGVLVRSSIGSNEKSHGETGFGLVYPSLRILRKPSRSSSCSALSWRLPTWPFDSIAEVA